MILTIIAGLIFTLTVFQTAEAQKLSAKETSLISHLVKEANQPGYHSADDKYLRVTIGKSSYIAELKSGKVIEQIRAANSSGGFSGTYAEVQVNLLNKNKQETAQGAGQILKLTGSKWKRIALNETDYQCADVKSVPKATLKALKVECN
jgi:DNA-directed RNA polymerase specialized sigma54-like protein